MSGSEVLVTAVSPPVSLCSLQLIDPIDSCEPIHGLEPITDRP